MFSFIILLLLLYSNHHKTHQSQQPHPPESTPTGNAIVTHHKTHHKINKSPTTSNHKPTKPHQKFNKTLPPATTNQQNSTARERERESSVLSRATLGEGEIGLISVKPRRPPRRPPRATLGEGEIGLKSVKPRRPLRRPPRATLGEGEIGLRSVKPRRPPQSRVTIAKTNESHIGRGRDLRREQCRVRERKYFFY